MKKIILSLFSVFCTLSGFAQLLTENFNFTTTNIKNNGWNVHSGTSDSVATTGGLTFTGYEGSGIGNAANVIGAGYDYNKSLSASQYGDNTTIYTSLMVNFTQTGSTPVTGGYFFHLGKSASPTSFTAFCARLFAKMDASGNINMAISNSSSTPTYITTNYARNTTYLVILKYKINITGADSLQIWIRSAGVPATELAAGAPNAILTTETGQDTVNAVAIRQASNIPDVIIDGIRVGNTWNTGVLPVKYTSFNATVNNNQTYLMWSTASETNNKGFEIESSVDGNTFETIGFVKGNGNSNRENKYGFVDPHQSGSFYRLKQIDFDGKFEYSKIVNVNEDHLIVELSPNPFNDIIEINSNTTLVNVEIVDITGKTKMMEIIDGNKSVINTSDLSNGIYFIRINNGETVITKRIIKN